MLKKNSLNKWIHALNYSFITSITISTLLFISDIVRHQQFLSTQSNDFWWVLRMGSSLVSLRRQHPSCHDRSRELCYMMTPPPSLLQHRLCRTYKHEVGIRFIVLNFWDENSLVPYELSKRYKKGMVPNCSLTWLIDKTKCVYSSLTTKYIIAIRIFIFSPLQQFGHFT